MRHPRLRRFRAGFLKWIGAAVMYTLWRVHERIGMDLTMTIREVSPFGSSPPHPEPGGIVLLFHWMAPVAVAILFLYGCYDIFRGLQYYGHPTAASWPAHLKAYALDKANDNDDSNDGAKR
jgi:hypothetical protein